MAPHSKFSNVLKCLKTPEVRQNFATTPERLEKGAGGAKGSPTRPEKAVGGLNEEGERKVKSDKRIVYKANG